MGAMFALSQSSGNVLQSSGNVLSSSGNVLQSVGNVLQSAGNVLQSAGNVLQSSGNVLQSAGKLPKWYLHTAPCFSRWPWLFYQVDCLFDYVVWIDFISVEFRSCLLISAHELWEWFMLLTLFARLTYVYVLHGMVRLHYYGYLGNEGISLILVIHAFHHLFLVYYIGKDFYPAFFVVRSTVFHLLYLSHFILHETLSYQFYTSCIFILLILWFIYN